MPMLTNMTHTSRIWKSEDKRCNVEGYAANLLNRDVEDLVGVNLIVRL